MKYLFCLSFLFLSFIAYTQYTTPNNGINWTIDSLTQHSSGAVIKTNNLYIITSPIIISAHDSICIVKNDTILMRENTYIENNGYLLINPPDSIVITGENILTNYPWLGIKLNENHKTYINKAHFFYAGGIKSFKGKFTATNSIFRNFFNSSGTSITSGGAIEITGAANIENCKFISNQTAAINSAANTLSPIIIRNCYFYDNVTENSNRPQINLGPTGANDTSFIVGNTVIGNNHQQSGGIAFASLVEVEGNVVIDSNIVKNNRYGITLTGAPINGKIRHNTLIDNNIQNNPNLGGSGLNFTSNSTTLTQKAVVTGNNIRGHLWGITIIGTPEINMGDTSSNNFNPGLNYFINNGNNGNLYDLYNNSTKTQYAMLNHWGVSEQDSANIETVITHSADDPNLGQVFFMPAGFTSNYNSIQTNFWQLYPNPTNTITTILGDKVDKAEIFNIQGKLIKIINNNIREIDLTNFHSGIYYIKLHNKNNQTTFKIIKY